MDFTPRPGAAPRGVAIASQARTETRMLLRNGEQLLLALVIPLGILLVGSWWGPGQGIDVPELVGSVLALAVFSTAFTSTAIATGFERRQGVLERLAATPLGRTGLVAGKAGAVTTVIGLQVAVLMAVSLLLGWRPTAGGLSWLVAVVTSVASTTSFVALAMALAGRLRAEATLALANLVHLLVAVGGGLVVALDRLPQAWSAIVRFTPGAALGESLRALAGGPVLLFPVPVAVAWAIGSVLLTRKVFRWTS